MLIFQVEFRINDLMVVLINSALVKESTERSHIVFVERSSLSNLLCGLAKAAKNALQFVIAGLPQMLSSLSILFTPRPDDRILTRPLPSSVFSSESTSRLDARF